ncbi:MAG: hypothetical protein ACLRQ0_09245 [Monoglobales bacterium]
MNQIYEVNVMAHVMKPFYVSAETAEKAGKIAEVLYNNGMIDINKEMEVNVEAVSLNGDEYYDGRIDKNNQHTDVSSDDCCKDCTLYRIYNSIADEKNSVELPGSRA